MLGGSQVASLYVKLGASTQEFDRAMSSAKGQMDNFGKTAGVISGAVVTFAKVGGAALVAFSATIGAVGVNFNNMKQQAEIAFTTMLGSGERARAFLDDLQDFAAKTPFEFPDLIRASQRLLAMGIEANKVRPYLTAIGDAVAALGGSSEMIDRVTLAIGQMQARGKVSAEEMLQLTEAGIPAWQMLADAIGTDIPTAMKMATQGAISADVAIKGLVDGMNARFGGLMEKQSQIFGGLISTLKDTAVQAAGVVMQPAFEAMTRGLKVLVDFTSQPAFTAGVRAFADQMQRWVSAGVDFAQRTLPPLIAGLQKVWEIGTIVVGAIREMIQSFLDTFMPVTSAFLKMVTLKDALTALVIILAGPVLAAIGGFIAAMWPIIQTVALVTAAVAAMRIAWTNDWLGIKSFTVRLLEQFTEWFKTNTGLWRGNWEDTIAYLNQNGFTGWKLLFFTKLPGLIGTFFRETRDWLLGWINTWMGRITTWGLEFYDSVKHRFNIIKQETTHILLTWLNDTMNKVDYWVFRVTNFFEQLYIKTTDKVEKIWREVTGWFQRTFDWFRPNEWWDKGWAIIDGLWQGMKAKWDGFWSWIQGKWNDLREGFKRFFGIASPSKVFMEFGQNIGEGLNLGLAKSLSVTPQVLTEGVMGGNSYQGATYNNTTSNTFNLSMGGATGDQATDLRATVTRLSMLYA